MDFSKEAMDSLLKKFQKMKMGGTQEVTTLEEMNDYLISHGKDYKGRRYQEVYDTEPKYIAWLLAHAKDNTKSKTTRQITFLNYIRMRIEAEEKELGLKPEPKEEEVKQEHKGEVKEEKFGNDAWSEISDPELILVEERVDNIEGRLNNMEGMLTEVVNFIRQAKTGK
jgi:hypothetical protein